MQIEPAEMDDLDEIAALWVALANGQRAHRSHLRAEGNREAIREAIARTIVTDGVRVVREDEEIVAFVMFNLESGRFEQDIERGIVQNLFVRPERRDEGIGSRLLAAAERALASAGAEAVGLDAMAANEDARRFYERHGYRPHRIEFEKPVENDTNSSVDG
jgi:ribosomal protein S18 acetylase RimI-like enzyme